MEVNLRSDRPSASNRSGVVFIERRRETLSAVPLTKGMGGKDYGFKANKGTHEDFYTSDYKYA
jgi:hypothetical protein